MRVAYLSTDEVNQALAAEMALAWGATIHPRWPRDGPPDGEYDALLYDWDSWPAAGRRQLLAGLAGGPRHRPVAVLGYNLTEDEAEALGAHSVAVHRSLHADVFRHLRQAALSVLPTGALAGGEEARHEAGVQGRPSGLPIRAGS
jgi:hypothetical protein